MGRKKGKQPERSPPDWPSWEAEWLSASDPETMCKILGGLEYEAGYQTSTRKLRLFTVACLYRIRHVFNDERTSGLVGALEQVADDVITMEEFERMEAQASHPPNEDARDPDQDCPPAKRPAAGGCSALGFASAPPLHWWQTYVSAHWARDAAGEELTERPIQATILRELFGNPFRPVSLDPAWRTPTVTALATTAYEERTLPAATLDIDRLAVLADALEDA